MARRFQTACSGPDVADRLRGLYVITDPVLTPANFLHSMVAAALRGGASIVQYRDKGRDPTRRERELTELIALCHRFDALCIVNDDIELAARCDADGVHLGMDDDDIAKARARLGSQAIIGASCYNDPARATRARAAGANYVAFGRFFVSGTKPSAAAADIATLRTARAELTCPIAAIGGITAENARPLLAAGADMLAVVGGVFGARDVRHAAHALSVLAERFRRPGRE